MTAPHLIDDLNAIVSALRADLSGKNVKVCQAELLRLSEEKISGTVPPQA